MRNEIKLPSTGDESHLSTVQISLRRAAITLGDPKLPCLPLDSIGNALSTSQVLQFDNSCAQTNLAF